MDGRVFVAGGEYGTGKSTAEVYDPTTDTWMYTPAAGQSFSDSMAKIIANGNVLVGPVGPSPSGTTAIYSPVTNTWTTGIPLFGAHSQNEASWVKLPDDSVLTIDIGGATSQRYIPSLNKWIADAPPAVNVYDPYGSETGAALLLPDGRAFFLGSSGHTAIYTPSGDTNLGSWIAGADIPNAQGTPDAAAAMMVNGKILCAVSPVPVSTNHFPSPTSYYEYDYLANTFTNVGAPGGATNVNIPAYFTTMLDLPDGTVLHAKFASQLYVYQPDGSPLTNGKPAIIAITTNLDGTLHLTGTLLNGISEGAAYGDDAQMDSNYPIVRMTDTNGIVFYARTFNWTSTSVMNTNETSVEIKLPAGLLGGDYSLEVVANGIASDPLAIAAPSTPMPPVKNFGFTSKTATRFILRWNDIGFYEDGYRLERSTNGIVFNTASNIGPNGTSVSNTVTALGQYYYRLIATNELGDGIATPVIFAASPPTATIPAPWKTADLGDVGGTGASGLTGGTYTVIGTGGGIGKTNDECQFAYQTLTGDFVFTARIISNLSSADSAFAGIMLRDTLLSNACSVTMGFGLTNEAPAFIARTFPRGVATNSIGPNASVAPYWVRLVKWANTVTGYRSADGVTWTKQGFARIPVAPQLYVGLAATAGTNTLLNTATFDNVSIIRTASPELTVIPAGGTPFTNECHVAYVEPGATTLAPLANVAAGGSNSFAVRADGTLAGWGNNSSGQTTLPFTATNLVSVAVGRSHVAAVRTDGRLFAWGDNSSGQTNALTTTNFIAAAAGSEFTLALRTDGTVTGWGATNSGQLSIPSSVSSCMAIAAGPSNSLALKTDGTVVGWGFNGVAQTNIPSTVTNIAAIASGTYHCLALRGDGKVLGWGANSNGQTSIPPTATNAIAIAAGGSHSMALRADGRVFSWGLNSSGQTNIPPTATNIVAIAAGEAHCLALRADGVVFAWGGNTAGQTNVPANVSAMIPSLNITGTVVTNSPGTNLLTYAATNSLGGSGTTNRLVVVADRIGPVIALNGPNPLVLFLNTPFVEPGATATDLCAGNVSSGIVIGGTVNTNVEGNYFLTYSINDGNGNISMTNRQVIVYGPTDVSTVSQTLAGNVQLNFTGWPGVPYGVFASTNLSDWLLLGTATNPIANLFQFIDVDATNYPRRFYQLRGP